MSTTTDIFTKTRIRLLSKTPWFGQLAMQLNLVENPSIKSVNTDGTDLEVNPDFFGKLPQLEREGVMAVKVFQCAMRHPYRMGGRDLTKWNKASLDVAHANVAKAGFKLPADCVIDSRYETMSVEQAYSLNEMEEQQEEEQNPQGKPEEGEDGSEPGPSTGTISPPGKPGEGDAEGEGDSPSDQEPQSGGQPGNGQPKKMSADDWAIAAEQATWLAAKAGMGSANLEQAVATNRTATVSWREELKEFVTHVVPSDVSFTKPNRRFMAQGLILPGPIKENMGELVVIFDTSGSVYSDSKTVEDFTAEVVSIAREVRPDKLTVIYCDTKVTHVDTYDTYDLDTIEIRPLGAGGTEFQPAFDYVAEMDSQPEAIIYLTDLEPGSVPQDPGIPTLWVAPAWVKKEAWFGTTIKIDRHQ